MIFAAIAGSSTPVVLIVMPNTGGLVLIAAMWSTALLGAALKLCRWQRGDTVGTRFYIGVSVMAGVALPWLYAAAGVVPSILFVVSGMIYIAGSITFANRWPRLKRPAVFSYHEVWHLMTVVAAGAHFAAVWSIAT
jgi:hemolysin III